jgi:hypothetical protein
VAAGVRLGAGYRLPGGAAEPLALANTDFGTGGLQLVLLLSLASAHRWVAGLGVAVLVAEPGRWGSPNGPQVVLGVVRGLAAGS